MEKWREVSDDGGNGEVNLDVVLRIEKCRFDSCKERLRGVFDELLVAFLREKSASKYIRRVPVFCGDGRPVDLFKLFWVVRKAGGHDVISRNNLWGFVSEECGFGFGLVPFVKLVYMKYLKELDQWLQQVFSKSASEDGLSEVVQKLDLLYWELEKGVRGLSQDGQGAKEREKGHEFGRHVEHGMFVVSDVISEQENGKLCNGGHRIDNVAALSKREVKGDVNESNGFSEGQIREDFQKFSDDESDSIVVSTKEIIDRLINKVLNPVQDNNDTCTLAEKVAKKSNSEANDLSVEIMDDEERSAAQQSIPGVMPRAVGNELESRKRKQQSEFFSGMLRWLTHVAKHSNDPSVGYLPNYVKWRDYGTEELWMRALLVREALQIRRHHNTNARQSLLKDQRKKLRMHPSMYEDNICDSRSKEKTRYSTRIPSSVRSSLCSCCNPRPAPQTKTAVCQDEKLGHDVKAPVELVATDVEEPPPQLDDQKSTDLGIEMQVSVGPIFQAEVPEWTGVHTESDPKWLGTRMWQPEEDESNSRGLGSIGKGRPQMCTCPFPHSVECVRFHIAEKRFKLKQELGSLFYQWRFNLMGEEVSLSWTEEEENTFTDMMKSSAPLPNKFWNNASQFFPSKTRQKLVSYYFNVFLVQRRSYQNRVTPNNVDSDDDEKECGSIGSRFGYKALYVPGLTSISCTLNKEPTELGSPNEDVCASSATHSP